MTVSTFFPDAHIENNTVDGHVGHSVNTVWDTIHDAAGDQFNDGSTGMNTKIECTTSQDFWDIFQRSIVLFDTSSIGASSTIDSATMQLVGIEKFDDIGGGHSISVATSNPASNVGLANGDYAQFGTVKQATDLTIAGITANSSTYNTFILNAAGEASISKDSITKFGLLVTADLEDIEPTWVSNEIASLRWKTADQAETTLDPKLVVTFTEGGFPTQVASSGVI